jgi:hypothetical protein
MTKDEMAAADQTSRAKVNNPITTSGDAMISDASTQGPTIHRERRVARSDVVEPDRAGGPADFVRPLATP